MEVRKEYFDKIQRLARFRMECAIHRQRGLEQEDGRIIGQIHRQQEELEELEKKAEQEQLVIPLAYFLRRFSWNEFERHVILLLAAYELDYRFAGLLASFYEKSGIGYVTPVLARESFEYRMEEAQLNEVFREDSLFSRFFPGNKEEGEDSHFKMLRMDNRMRAFFLNGQISAPQYRDFIRMETMQEEDGPLQDERGILQELTRLAGNVQSGGGQAICLYGPEGSGRKEYFRRLARGMKQVPAFLMLGGLSPEEGEYRIQIAQYERELRLLETAPIITGVTEAEWKDPEKRRRLRFLLSSLFSELDRVYLTADGPIYDRGIAEQADLIQIEAGELSLTASREIWKTEAQKYRQEDALPEALTNQFLLTPGKIKEAFRLAKCFCDMEGGAKIGEGELRRACFSLTEGMGDKAVRVRSHYGWEQLVLPKEQKEELRAAFHQIKYRKLVFESWGLAKTMAYGRGLSILLYGPPGTGKTMAAQVLAGELGAELYQVRIAAIFSKYIGETEKNLQQIFEEAGKNRMILFFDEADILFSKRTEVRSSHDKFNNMQAAFLLQKLEEYEGISIMATNYFQNFDEAFKRRIQYFIEFPFPDREARRSLWEKAIPPEMPVRDLDLGFLSGLELTGSNIKNILCRAAFSAAAEGAALHMGLVMNAVRQEARKLGKVLTREELGEYYFEEIDQS